MSNSDQQILYSTLLEADRKGEFVDGELLNKLQKYFGKGSKRLSVVTSMTSNIDLILKETFKESSIYSSNFYTARKLAACIRDLEFFLRYIIYAMLSGTASIIDERVLDGLVETYVALDISMSMTSHTIQIMEVVTINLIEEQDEEILSELSSYFKRIYSVFPWEPQNHDEWIQLDPLAQVIKLQKKQSLSFHLESSVFFESLQSLPSQIRQEIWWERTVMAELFKRMDEWQSIPNFHYVGVGKRTIDGKDRLVGIINLYSDLPSEAHHEDFNIPRVISINSSIAELKKFSSKIPIFVEKSDSIAYNSAYSQSLETPSTSIDQLSIQSGDKITGKTSATISTFVKYSHLESGSFQKEYLLTVHHAFKHITDATILMSGKKIRVGTVFQKWDSLHTKDYAERLDIELVEINSEFRGMMNPYLKWIDEYPKKPIPIWSGSPVQMFGASSGHQIGRVNESMYMCPSKQQSIIPDFTATIQCEQGDSGALLVIGHDTSYPDTSEGMLEELEKTIMYSMQGILLGGTTDPSNQKTFFRPMIAISSWLDLRLCTV